jgi:hypothetical protein
LTVIECAVDRSCIIGSGNGRKEDEIDTEYWPGGHRPPQPFRVQPLASFTTSLTGARE